MDMFRSRTKRQTALGALLLALGAAVAAVSLSPLDDATTNAVVWVIGALMVLLAILQVRSQDEAQAKRWYALNYWGAFIGSFFVIALFVALKLDVISFASVDAVVSHWKLGEGPEGHFLAGMFVAALLPIAGLFVADCVMSLRRR